MAANREERFLMRQRGAGARQLQDFGFNIALPGVTKSPLKPIRSGRLRRTPQQALPPQRSTGRTPNPAVLLPTSSSRRTPGRPRKTQLASQPLQRTSEILILSNEPASQPTRSDGQGSIVKKRRLTKSKSIIDSASAKRRAGVETPVELGIVDGGASTRVTSAQQKQRRHAEENGEAATTPITSNVSPGKKRKKRKSIGQTSKRRSRASIQTPLLQQESVVEAPASSSNLRPAQDTNNSAVAHAQVNDLVLEISQQDGDAKPRKRKRRSIGTRPKKRRKSADTVSPMVEAADVPPIEKPYSGVSHSRKPSGRTRLAPVDEESEKENERPSRTYHNGADNPVIEKDSSLSVLQTSGRPKNSKIAGRAQKTTLAEDISTAEAAPKKNNRRKPLSSAARNISENPKRPREKIESIPITVNRLSRARIPVIEILDGEEGDILAAPAPFPKNSNVNPIDVLSQICREMIAKTVDTIDENAQSDHDSSHRAQWKRKREVVEMFGDELDARLFQMTEALDDNINLTTRLRQANKRKANARATLLDLRRQREDIALQMDAVRARHDKAAKQAEESHTLNTLLQDIELAVQRGRANEARMKSGDHAGLEDEQESDGDVGAGLELRLRHVTAELGSAGGLGLLERAKAFNTEMERILNVR